jgi:hypothetical protein
MKDLVQTLNHPKALHGRSAHTVTLSLSPSDSSTTRAWLRDLQRLRLDQEAFQHLATANPTQARQLENGDWRLDFFQNITVHAIEYRSKSAVQDFSFD